MAIINTPNGPVEVPDDSATARMYDTWEDAFHAEIEESCRLSMEAYNEAIAAGITDPCWIPGCTNHYPGVGRACKPCNDDYQIRKFGRILES